jgi:hypothetical protein
VAKKMDWIENESCGADCSGRGDRIPLNQRARCTCD